MSADVTITWFTRERFFADRQVGLLITQDRPGIMRSLTWPRVASEKTDVGAWCPCALEGGVVKGGKGPVAFLVGDVDDCAEGAIDHTAAALGAYEGAVVPTFSATPEKPKHRIILAITRALQSDEFRLAWRKLQRELAHAGIVVDKGCKNINRLYFGCATPSLERWRQLGGARLLRGAPVDADAMIGVAREEADEAERARARKAKPLPVRQNHMDKYVAAAIEKARANVAAAAEGERHDALLRESFSLARLGLTDHDVADVLLDAFVAAAGEHRRREGERAIRDAVHARHTRTA